MSAGRRLAVVADGSYLPARADARVLVWEGPHITWVGRDPGAAPPVDVTIALPGAWISPGLVDAHVHATATGMMLDGLDLSTTTSAEDVLATLRQYAARCDDDPIVGSGWQEHDWPVPHPPTATDIARAAPGRRVLLNRVDGHSCLVDPRTLAVAADSPDGVDRDGDQRPTGWLREQAAERARRTIWLRLPTGRLDRARRAAAAHAARQGIVSMHEMGHPGLSSLDDALAWASGQWDVEVLVWWADIRVDDVLRHRLRPGGDLFLDGAIGSRTAAVSHGYRDGPALGGLFHTDDAVAEFFVRSTRTGVGGAVHAIGDRAIEQAIGAIEAAAAHHGADAVRACRHRIEHVEIATDAHARRMADLGVVASMQPAFDARWGGADGMYAQRFGEVVARDSNPIDAFVAAGCPLAFSSDAPVTPMAPWQGVAAATAHRGGRGIDAITALTAATVGGRYAAHQDEVGTLRAGHRADFAVWDGDPIMATAVPACVLTVMAGRITQSNQTISLSD